MGEPQKRGVRIVCISDTHTKHASLSIPDGDILIHGGDFTSFGKVEHITEFNTWLGTLPHPTKIVIAGNHENGMLRQHPLRTLLSNATYLDQESVVVNGLKIFGTKFFWPCPSGNPYYDQIPIDTNILVSHSPPKGYYDGGSGCPSLTEKVKLIKPLLHVFGRILEYTSFDCLSLLASSSRPSSHPLFAPSLACRLFASFRFSTPIVSLSVLYPHRLSPRLLLNDSITNTYISILHMERDAERGSFVIQFS